MRFLVWARHVVAVSVLALSLMVVAGPPASAQSPAGCDDNRDWTLDVLTGSTCNHLNLCSPEKIELAVPEDLVWAWTFPESCPMDAIDAVGVLVTAEAPYDETLGPAAGTRPLLSSHGTTAPDRVGGGSVPVTCGRVELVFTVVAGSEVVATGQGVSETGPCPAVDLPDPPPAFLGVFDEASGSSGAFARLYWAVFGRLPDNEGFGYWMARADGGLSLRAAAAAWTSVPEWTEAYAGTDDSEFLDRIYQNVLGREPDRGGFDYWLDRLGDGMARDELVVQFSGAPEFRDRTGTS